MTFTANELKQALKSDGNLINGESIGDDYAIGFGFQEVWWEGNVGDVINVLGLGDFEVIEHVVGKTGEVEYGDGYNVWNNYIILKHGDRHFRLPGEYDSWDGKGWTREVEEVSRVEKTITVWEKNLDY